MAVLEIFTEATPGIKKEIDEGAYDLILNALQGDIYSFPIKSFVRESVSNGLDAVVERDIHFAITREGKSVESFYLQRQDNKLLKDSSYNPDYYEDKYLSDDSVVLITYDIPEGMRRHTMEIKDYGVGLGGSRLQGFFKLGYSSKRNLKDVFGKWGSGAKAGLATGVDYFMMTTVYNGYTTSFQIYKTDYEPVTPEREDSVKEVWTVPMANGTTQQRSVYWTPSEEPNSVSITLEVKPVNKDSFFQAVIEQFQHFNGRVNFRYKNGDNWVMNYLNDIPIYESKSMLIPTRSSYHSPIILVDGISYGLISWGELELEDRAGVVALKTRASDIDITQSRESLKWTAKTKKVVLEAIKQAKIEATEYVSGRLELDDPYDLFEVIERYSHVNKGSDKVMRVFSQFLNMTNLKPDYKFNPKWLGKELSATLDTKLFNNLFYGYSLKKVSVKLNMQNKVVIERTYVTSFDEFSYMSVVYAEKSSLGPRTANYILNEDLNKTTIIYIRPSYSGRKETTIGEETFSASAIARYTRELLLRRMDIYLDKYEYEIVEEEKIDDDDKVELETSSVNIAKLRRQNAIVIYRSLTDYNTLQTTELKKSSLEARFKGKNVIIATQDYREEAEYLKAIADTLNAYKADKFDIIFVSKDILRDFLPYGTFITDFIRKYDSKTKEITIDPLTYRLNTSLKIEEVREKYIKANLPWKPSLAKALNPSLVKNDSKGFNPILDDYQLHYLKTKILKDNKVFKNIIQFLNDLDLIDNLQNQHASKSIIKSTTEACFGVSELKHIDSYDKNLVAKFEEYCIYLMPIRKLVNLFYTHNSSDEYKSSINTIKLLINTLNIK